MKVAIIASKKDPAGMNILDCLREYDLGSLNAQIHIFDDDTIYLEKIDEKLDADLLIFATRHASAKEVHALSCHAPGNWSDNQAGGNKSTLGPTSATYLKEIFLLLNKHNNLDDFVVTMECTHHGPTLTTPSFFIEIGSNESQWSNKDAGIIIAKVLVDFLTKLDNSQLGNYQATVGLGGTHYLATLNKFQLNSDIAIGHTCPKHQLEFLDESMLKQAIEKTKEDVNFVLLDWKGLGKEKQRIVALLDELNIDYKRTDQLK